MGLLSSFEGYRVRRVRNALFDLRSGGLLAGGSRTRHAGKGAHDVVNTDVTALERIFDGRIRESDVLVDVGCGKGRVVRWWVKNGVGRRFVGLELDEDVAAQTGERLARHEKATIVAGDAIASLPPDATVFFLANPFDEPVVRAFSDRAKELYRERGVTLLYYNPEHVGVFRDDPDWAVEDVSIGGDSFHELCVVRLG